jgi:hypothetical protein
VLGLHVGNGSTRIRDSRLTSNLVGGVVVFIPLFNLVKKGELVMKLVKDDKTNLLAGYGYLKKVWVRNVRSCLYLAYAVTKCCCGVVDGRVR